MAARITRADIDNALSRVKRAHDTLGISRRVYISALDINDPYNVDAGFSDRLVDDGDGRAHIDLSSQDLRVQIGSPTNGRAYRLFYLGPNGARYEASRDYLGWTAREAFSALGYMFAGLSDAINAMNGE